MKTRAKHLSVMRGGTKVLFACFWIVIVCSVFIALSVGSHINSGLEADPRSSLDLWKSWINPPQLDPHKAFQSHDANVHSWEEILPWSSVSINPSVSHALLGVDSSVGNPNTLNLFGKLHGSTWLGPVRQLDASRQQEHEKVVRQAVKKCLEGSYQATLQRMMHIYERVDPTFGHAYIVDLYFKAKDKTDMFKRVKVVRYGKAILPVSAASHDISTPKVHLLFPLSSPQAAYVKSFLTTLSGVAAQDHNFSLLVLCANQATLNSSQQIAQPFFQSGQLDSASVQFSLAAGAKDRADILTIGVNSLSSNELMLFVDLTVRFSASLLRNTRLNTSPNRQVFYPVGFTTFPDSVHVATTKVEQKGYWHYSDFSLVGIYKDDFNRVGGFAGSNPGWGMEPLSLLQNILHQQDPPLQIFRSVELDLHVPYRDVTCPASLPADTRAACTAKKLETLDLERALATRLAECSRKEREGFGAPAGTTTPAPVSSSSNSNLNLNLSAHPNVSVFVYEMPAQFNKGQIELNKKNPPKIRDPDCTTNFYCSEYSFHQYLLTSPFRTLQPDQADFFFVPVYPVCFLLNNLPNNLTLTGQFLGKALNYVKTALPYWNRTAGANHVFLFSQGFGASMFNERYDEVKNSIFVVSNGEFTKSHFTPHKDIAIPPDVSHYTTPVYSLPNASAYAPPSAKKTLAFFGGSVFPSNLTDHRGSFYSKGVRQYFKSFFMKHPGFKISGTRSATYWEDLRTSKFCLCPEGWHAWTPRPIEAIISGCVPVLLSEEVELPFEETIDYAGVLIRVRPASVAKLPQVLGNISESRRAAMVLEGKKIHHLLHWGPGGEAGLQIIRHLERRKPAVRTKRMYEA